MSGNQATQLAHSLQSASKTTGIGRDRLYDAMATGELKARKYGKRTIILDDDLRDFLRALPPLKLSRSAA
ncbi:MAG: DNA-binding protein [Hyphomicrobiales bacterium]|nr:DNA-binding protein [Hyphomicrobiales bacterium]